MPPVLIDNPILNSQYREPTRYFPTPRTPRRGIRRAGPTDPDLVSLIATWPTLPEPIRAAILSRIRAAGT
jgi:hypothetical protein